MNYPENYIGQLKRLLQIILDSRKGYQEAASMVESQELKEAFGRVAAERETLATALKDRIAQYGGNPDDLSGDFLATLHRSWMGIKTAMTKRTDQTILESCRNGDQAALDAFDDVLQGDLLNDSNLKTFLVVQRHKINEAFMEMEERYFKLFKKDPTI